MATPFDAERKLLLQEYLKRIRAQGDPRLRALAMQQQQGKEDLATAGQFAAGASEAAAMMGGTQAGKSLPTLAQKFEQRAAEGRRQPKMGYDPKLFKYLDSARAKKQKGLKYGPGEFDPKTGDTRKFLRTEEGDKFGEGVLTGSKGFERKEKIFRQYRDNPVTKKSDLLAVNYQKIKNAASTPSAAGDISLIFGFMKMIDPGSTVREGEFATAAQAGAVPERVWGLYNRIINGERLTDTQKADFQNQAFLIWEAQLKSQKDVDQRFGDFAKENNISFKPFTWDVTRDEDLPDDIKNMSEEDIPDDIKNMSIEELKREAGVE